MADQQQSNHQRDHDGDEKSKPKRQKPNENETKPIDSTTEREEKGNPKASITTINYDCLERIFDFLNLESLLNVAGTCKHLQIAAAAKFKDEHGNRKVWLHPFYPYHGIFNIVLYIDVNGLKLCLPFLRCFGARISNLIVYYSDSTSCRLSVRPFTVSSAIRPYYVRSEDVLNRKDTLDRYINQYCADALTSIEFPTYQVPSSEFYSKPFTNVQKIIIKSGHLKDQLPNGSPTSCIETIPISSQ